MYKQHKIAVVVPAYMEEELISETLSGIPDFIDKIYAVDDGSPDDTFQIIHMLSEKDSRIIPVKVIKNGGVGYDLSLGCEAGYSDYGGDGQAEVEFGVLVGVYAEKGQDCGQDEDVVEQPVALVNKQDCVFCE